MHTDLGCLNARIQAWFHFRIQICLNGREWLVRQLEAQRIAHLRQDDWVVCVKDFSRAPGQLDAQLCSDWPGLLDGMAAEPNPIHEQMFGKLDVQNCLSTYQSERAINVVFRQQDFMRRL